MAAVDRLPIHRDAGSKRGHEELGFFFFSSPLTHGVFLSPQICSSRSFFATRSGTSCVIDFLGGVLVASRQVCSAPALGGRTGRRVTAFCGGDDKIGKWASIFSAITDFHSPPSPSGSFTGAKEIIYLNVKTPPLFFFLAKKKLVRSHAIIGGRNIFCCHAAVWNGGKVSFTWGTAGSGAWIFFGGGGAGALQEGCVRGVDRRLNNNAHIFEIVRCQASRQSRPISTFHGPDFGGLGSML